MINEQTTELEKVLNQIGEDVSKRVARKQEELFFDDIIDICMGKYSYLDGYEAYHQKKTSVEITIDYYGVEIPVGQYILNKEQFDYVEALIQKVSYSNGSPFHKDLKIKRLEGVLIRSVELLRSRGENAVSEVLGILQGALDDEELSEIG